MIYLLEDDDNIRKLVNYGLNSQNIPCQDFSLPSKFWNAYNKEKPDLALLDIMLPEEDGISILKKIRETSSIPVIMLTAKDSEFDIVKGLDTGADDYITKPFSIKALVARVKAVLRRYEKSNQKNLETNKKSEKLTLEINQNGNKGMIIVDLTKHTVFSDNEQIILTSKEFDLLALFIENKGKIFTREKLLNFIWKINANVESRTVDVHIRTLRQKLGKYGNVIETIRGMGYKISSQISNNNFDSNNNIGEIY